MAKDEKVSNDLGDVEKTAATESIAVQSGSLNPHDRPADKAGPTQEPDKTIARREKSPRAAQILRDGKEFEATISAKEAARAQTQQEEKSAAPERPSRRLPFPQLPSNSIASSPRLTEEQIEQRTQRQYAEKKERPHDVRWEADYRRSLLAADEAGRRQRDETDKRTRVSAEREDQARSEQAKRDSNASVTNPSRETPERENTDRRARVAQILRDGKEFEMREAAREITRSGGRGGME